MTEKTFKGCGTALLTPFKEDYSIDYDAYSQLVERQVNGGVSFLTPLGTSGETPTLSKSEKRELLEMTHAHAHGLPLLVGVGSNSIPYTLENMELVKDLADAFLVVVPFYNKPTQEGMYLYYKELARNSSKPIIMYNVPGRTGVNMMAETSIRIAREVKGIIGIKEASGNLEQVKQILCGAPEGFTVLSGDDDMTFDIIHNGGDGVVSVASNILPNQVSDMVRYASLGNEVEAKKLNDRLMPLFKACFVEPNPIPGKAALSMLGLCSDTVRLPLTKANSHTRAIIKSVLQEWK